METRDIALGVEAWAADLLAINSYPEPPSSLGQALPLVMAEVTGDRVVQADARFQNYQQTLMRVWSVDMVILIAPQPEWDASQALYGYVDKISKDLRTNKTLGGRVPAVTPTYEASYDPPEVEYTDGTVARQVTVRLNVGEQEGGP